MFNIANSYQESMMLVINYSLCNSDLSIDISTNKIKSSARKLKNERIRSWLSAEDISDISLYAGVNDYYSYLKDVYG
jgi:hypothetical protein